MNRKKEEPIGQAWFYHVPPKNDNKQAAGYPLLSQIPGLGHSGSSSDEPQSKHGWIKDTDSAYTRLAKQGGRPDLLNMQPGPSSKQSLASPNRGSYQRCDWYYHNEPVRNQSESSSSTTSASNTNGSNLNECQTEDVSSSALKHDPVKLD